jgi:hypothetical protein
LCVRGNGIQTPLIPGSPAPFFEWFFKQISIPVVTTSTTPLEDVVNQHSTSSPVAKILVLAMPLLCDAMHVFLLGDDVTKQADSGRTVALVRTRQEMCLN